MTAGRALVTAVAVAIAITLPSGAAEARSWRRLADRLQGGTYLHYELSGVYAFDDEPARTGGRSQPDEVVLAGARLGGFVGTGSTVAYHIALELMGGSTIGNAGFAYDVALYPLGVAVRFGETGFVALSTGVLASGAVGTIDDAVALPASLTVELGRGWRMLGRARIAYIAGAASRQSGAPNVPFADEFDAMLGIRFGHAYKRFERMVSGNGYFVGVDYREQAGTRYAGITLGYSIDVASVRRTHHRDPS